MGFGPTHLVVMQFLRGGRIRCHWDAFGGLQVLQSLQVVAQVGFGLGELGAGAQDLRLLFGGEGGLLHGRRSRGMDFDALAQVPRLDGRRLVLRRGLGGQI